MGMGMGMGMGVGIGVVGSVKGFWDRRDRAPYLDDDLEVSRSARILDGCDGQLTGEGIVKRNSEGIEEAPAEEEEVN
jgi:hypothetical protein